MAKAYKNRLMSVVVGDIAGSAYGLKLAISLGGDADTLAAIAGPMAYAFYREMPDDLVNKAMKTLPDWMADVNDRFDAECDRSKCYPSFSVPLVSFPDKVD